MEILDSLAALHTFKQQSNRQSSQARAFVPTMGNLHSGHLHLIDIAKTQAQQVWVSIFVNPMQFVAGEDYDHYPRTLEDDIEKLQKAGVTVLFLPRVADMYPRPLNEITQITVPILSDDLCGVHRPGHFTGVATVVNRLFNLVQPDVALFGQKDLQQLRIIQRMVSDLAMPINIVSVPTQRETDGLAKSSRNRYLTVQQRETAAYLHQTLQTIKHAIQQGETDYHQLEQQAITALRVAGFKPDYVAIRDADSLQDLTTQAQVAIIAAAHLGQARLIDNLVWTRF